MIGGFLKGINVKSLTFAIIAVFVWVFVSDWIIHGTLLKAQYIETVSLWRSEAEMSKFMPWMILGQFLIAKFFVVIFVHGYKGQGMMEGVRYGIYVALLFSGSYLIQYTVSPLTCGILMGWIGYGLVQSIGAGVIAACVYKN